MIFSLNGCKDKVVKKSHRIVLLTTIIAVLLILWGATACNGEEKVSVSGITEPISDVTLSLSVPGIISRIFHREGSRVKKGEIILDLDKRIEELEVERRKVIWESKEELKGKETQANILKSLYDSNLELYERTGSVSKEELQKIELEWKLAAAELKQLKVEEEREEIEYKMALENLRKRVLRSPINGIIVKLLLDEGESSEAHQPLVQVVDIGRCNFVSNVEEGVGRTMKRGRSVELKIRTGSTYISKKGKIVFVSPVVDSASNLLVAKAEFDNHDGSVRPGVAGEMRLQVP